MESQDDTSASVSPLQGRRLACERCRSQKLKCEKSNIPNCCQRCRKADVQCSFGLALPPGRPRTQPAPPPVPTRSSEATKEPAENNHPIEVIASPTSFNADQAHQPFGSAGAFHQTSPFNDDSILDVSFTHDVLTNDYIGLPAALTATHPGSEPFDALVSIDHLQHTMASARDNFMMMDTQPSSPLLQPLQMPATSSLTRPRGYKTMQAPTGSLAALVRRAADLSDNMYELRIKYHHGKHSELDAPGQFPTHMSGEVLQAAQDFLTLLRGFFWEETPPSAGSSSTHSLTLVPTNTSSRTSSTSAILVEQPHRRVIHDADRPAALTMIAGYQRLLDLYLLYYQAVHEYIRDTEPAWRRSQSIWKDLHVGGASLCEFGDLHIKLIMQATARVLEEIEDALGLPVGCRVSHPPSGDVNVGGSGVLGTIVTSSFVEQCIAEGINGGSDQGLEQGIIAHIRETAANLSVALDTAGRR